MLDFPTLWKEFVHRFSYPSAMSSNSCSCHIPSLKLDCPTLVIIFPSANVSCKKPSNFSGESPHRRASQEVSWNLRAGSMIGLVFFWKPRNIFRKKMSKIRKQKNMRKIYVKPYPFCASLEQWQCVWVPFLHVSFQDIGVPWLTHRNVAFSQPDLGLHPQSSTTNGKSTKNIWNPTWYNCFV